MLSSKGNRPLGPARRTALIVGVAAAAAGLFASLLPPVLALEQSLGLAALYRFRGPIEPPSGVIVVGISADSVEALALTDAVRNDRDLKGWPRRLHADLVDALSAVGVGAIGFDIQFRTAQNPVDDDRFAAAIRQSGRVILFDRIVRDIDERQDGAASIRVESYRDRVEPPLEDFRRAALATAPFPLPDLDRAEQFWTFVPVAGDAPSLPVALYSIRTEALLRQIAGALAQPVEAATAPELMAGLRARLLNDPEAWSSPTRRSLVGIDVDALRQHEARLLTLLTGPESRYLNYYGPPRTITTVPVDTILRDGPDPALPWRDALVLVGYSDRTQPDQNDTFESVYSQNSGLDMSGVEIAATALANLLDGRVLSRVPVASQLAITVLLGSLLGACFLLRSSSAPIVLAVLAFAAYVWISVLQFELANVWMPLVVPVLIQLPLALLLGTRLRLTRAEEQREAITRGTRRYLPAELVERIAANPDSIARETETIEGTCLITDIQGYTSFAEQHSQQELESALNAYYDALAAIVVEHGGTTTDIVGDSMVAVWRAKADDDDARVRPVLAALGIRDRFESGVPPLFRTRVGLCSGQFSLGTVGAENHLEFRAVGDTVNSAARIQALNKRLATTVLASRDVLPSHGVLFRDVGRFQLPGKQLPLDVVEPVAALTYADPELRQFVDSYQRAIAAYLRGEYSDGLAQFEALLQRRPGDGPSLYYTNVIRGLLAEAGAPSVPPVIRQTD